MKKTLETRYKCQEPKCPYDRVVATDYEGKNNADNDKVALGHAFAHRYDKKGKSHRKLEHKVEVTHMIYEHKEGKK